MFVVFTRLADLLAYSVLGLSADSRLGQSVHFFIEDTTKIFALLVAMIYFIALIRASLDITAVRDRLAGNTRFAGYVMASFFGAVTPFCSCSSIPVFLGFISAGIPVGITMAFLLTSPLINEVAVLLLLSLVGWKTTLIYMAVGMTIGICGGILLDVIGAEKSLQPFALKAYQTARAGGGGGSGAGLSFGDRHEFARRELVDILQRVWKWVFAGVGLGAVLHGFVPDTWFAANLGHGEWWSVPAAVAAGVPLYANATGVIPVLETLIVKGVPLGTTLAFCMSTVAVSFPEFVLLKQVMTWRLLGVICLFLLAAFTLMGWIINAV